jgi:hypothetical protein
MPEGKGGPPAVKKGQVSPTSMLWTMPQEGVITAVPGAQEQVVD